MKRTRGEYPEIVFVHIFEEKLIERVSPYEKLFMFEDMTQEMQKIDWVKMDTKLLKLMSVLFERMNLPWEVEQKEFDTFIEEMNSSASNAANWMRELIIGIFELTEHFYDSNKMEKLMWELSSENNEMPPKFDIIHRAEQMSEFVLGLEMLTETQFMEVMETYMIFVYKKGVTMEESEENEEIFIDKFITCKNSCNKFRGALNKLLK